MRRRAGVRVDQWQALADPVRWSIVALLAERPRSVTELCEAMDLRQSTVSTHLGILREAGVVEARKRGYFNVYEVMPQTLITMADQLRRTAEKAQRLPDELDLSQHNRDRLFAEKWIRDQRTW